MTTVLIIGATGLVGSQLLDLTLNDERISAVKVFSRRPTGKSHPKLIEKIVDFEHINLWKQDLTGDILFSTLGTTLKEAGSREAQRIIDYDYQYRVAAFSKVNGVKTYVLVSAPHADPHSRVAYTRMKGELERDVLKLGYQGLTVVRPGPLYGPRETKRPAEEIFTKVLRKLPKIPGLETLRPVNGNEVAEVCLNAAFNNKKGVTILNPKDILELNKVRSSTK